MKKLLTSLCVVVCAYTNIVLADEPAQISAAEKLFAMKVQPLFVQKCGGCHGDEAKEIKGEFDMRSRHSTLAGGESGEPAVIPGKADQSPLMEAIRWETYEMPPKENDRLTSEEVAHVKRWIDAGAPWPNEERLKAIRAEAWESDSTDGIRVATSGGTSETWTNRLYDADNLWAYQPVVRPEVPWQYSGDSKNPIDAFINRKLAESQLEPLATADRRTLIRRVTFGLTGLPPTPAEIESFLAENSPQAWKQLIERLLASPRYGEQWARHWLDVVRYADSSGFANDFARANAWRYRDYVIRALNADKPYDEFLKQQIAGDELAPDDPESLIAVGFLRMGPWEHTSMSVEAVTRQQYLDDITNSVGVTFLGHELRCASCHDHKFDPIPTKDYYRIQAVFAPVQFVDRKVEYQSYENTNGFDDREARIIELQKSEGVLSLKTIPQHEWPVQEWDIDTEKKGHAKVRKKRSQYLDRERKRFQPWAFSVYSGPYRTVFSPRTIVGMPDSKQLRGTAPEVHILTGGSIESPADQVGPGVLSVVEWGEAGFEVPDSTVGRRAAFAEWLSDPKHPLTARVIVNRIWQYHFGSGLAGNPNNFGATGKKPSHPELLDFLADYLIQHNWSLKELHRLILTSDTWQRSSGPISDQVALKDPDNTLLSHFSPRRLAAEELRDSMLQVSGELNVEMGGLPVRPEINMEVAMQPRHVMGSVAPAYQPSRTAAERNRRTIYTERIRTLGNPMLEVFNQPGPDTSCERRDASTITPQAFTLLNSQESFDRALAFANRLSNASEDPQEQIRQAFRIAFGRKASPKELERCLKHYQTMLHVHKEQTPQKTTPPKYVVRQMVEEMTGLEFYWVEPLDIYENYQPHLKPWDVPPSTRAMAEVCLVLLNANEFVYIY